MVFFDTTQVDKADGLLESTTRPTQPPYSYKKNTITTKPKKCGRVDLVEAAVDDVGQPFEQHDFLPDRPAPVSRKGFKAATRTT